MGRDIMGQGTVGHDHNFLKYIKSGTRLDSTR